MNLETEVIEISSDDESEFEYLKTDDYGWISTLLNDINDEKDDQDDVVLVGEVKSKRNLESLSGLKLSAKEDDDDCVVLDGDPEKQVSLADNAVNESDELLVVSEKGQIACRDYPHPRHLCVKFPFISTPHELHCSQCHCYVCDSLAPCPHWGAGISSFDHCHATDKAEAWKLQRKNYKQLRSMLVPPSCFLDTALSIALPQVHKIQPHAQMTVKTPSQIQDSRSSTIRPCNCSTNIRRRVRSDAISRQLLNSGSRFVSPPSMFKRPGYAGSHSGSRVKYGSSSGHASLSGHSRKFSPSMEVAEKSPARLQGSYSYPELNTVPVFLQLQTQDSNPHEIQTLNAAAAPSSQDFGICRISNRQAAQTETINFQSAEPTNELPSVTETVQFLENVEPNLSFDFEDWLLENHSAPVPAPDPPPESNLFSPVDSGSLLFDFETFWNSSTHV